MLSPLKNKSNQTRSLTEKDVSHLKHHFIKIYGYDLWKEIPLDEFFEMLPELQKEITKQENLRLVLLKHCGVKNPK